MKKAHEGAPFLYVSASGNPEANRLCVIFRIFYIPAE